MTAGLGISSYIDIATYLRAPANQETASLLGLNTTTSGGSQPAGTTSLVVAASAGFAVGPAWILDGPTSEVVSITGSVDGTHVTLAAPGTAFAHSAGASVSQAGSKGSLAEVILRASAWMESYCQQGTSGGDRSLFALARTERWAMPTTRAFIDPDYVVTVRPGHFPVQSVASMSIELGQGNSLALDVSQVETPTTGRLVELPYLLQTPPQVGQQLLLETRGISRARRQWLVITYTGGITVGNVPYDVQQAAIWVVSDMLSQRLNPTGSAEVSLGKRTHIFRQRGDMTGDSILLLRAQDVLQSLKAETWA
jgi:hypothetical protein